MITLSSGEAELYGVVRGGAVGMGFLSLMSDLGVQVPLQVWTDSTASQGICARQGLGKVRHLDTQELWVQQRIRNGDFSLFKIDGESNPGDLFTKASLTHHRICTLLALMGCKYREGRAAAAPALRTVPGKERNLVVRTTTRWADSEDDYDDVMSEGEVEEWLQQKGLPHASSRRFKLVTVVQEKS